MPDLLDRRRSATPPHSASAVLASRAETPIRSAPVTSFSKRPAAGRIERVEPAARACAPTSARLAPRKRVDDLASDGAGTCSRRARRPARSATRSRRGRRRNRSDQANSSGSTRAIASARTWLGFASAKLSSPVSAASAQPRSGSGAVAKYSAISRNLPLRDGVKSSASSSAANRFTPPHPHSRRAASARALRPMPVGVMHQRLLAAVGDPDLLRRRPRRASPSARPNRRGRR